MGGVVVDADTRTEMPGLYVAGEDAGGAHGANRLGGNGVANSTVYGGIAGDVMAGDVTAAGRADRCATRIRRCSRPRSPGHGRRSTGQPATSTNCARR